MIPWKTARPVWKCPPGFLYTGIVVELHSYAIMLICLYIHYIYSHTMWSQDIQCEVRTYYFFSDLRNLDLKSKIIAINLAKELKNSSSCIIRQIIMFKTSNFVAFENLISMCLSKSFFLFHIEGNSSEVRLLLFLFLFHRVATVLEIREKSGKVKRPKIVREKSGNLRRKEGSQGKVREFKQVVRT